MKGGTKDEHIQRTQERKEKSKRQEYGGRERKRKKQKKSSCICGEHIHKVGNPDTGCPDAGAGGTYVNVDASEPDIDVQLLDVNPYSRPGIESNGITGIVIHYTANPGSTAQENRDYFNGLQYSQETSASSNFVVGLDGEIIQCVPTREVAYASNDRNYDTVSIEVCHPDESGKFTDETYRSLVQLTAWLCLKFNLTADDVIRHYDVTGKNCPKYYVEHEDAWETFKENVSLAITSES